MKTENISTRNNQRQTAAYLLTAALSLLIPAILPFSENNPLSGLWAVTFVSIFLSLSFAVTAAIFFKRAKKADKLIDGSELLFKWKLDDTMHQRFVNYQYQKAKAKNKAVIIVIGTLFFVITIPFLFMLEGDELPLFLLIMGGVFGLIFLSAFFFPWYYKSRNLSGDRKILLGARYAYINGVFHNWDFPLSGIEKVKPMLEPFRGINLRYYFTDRTGPRSYDLYIPVPEDIELEELIGKLSKNE
jgi:hypothetical protein